MMLVLECCKTFTDVSNIRMHNGEIQLKIMQIHEPDYRCNLQKLMIATIVYMNCELRIHI